MCAHRALLIVHYAVKVAHDVGMAETLQDGSFLPKCSCISAIFTYHSLYRNRGAMEAGFVDL